MRPENRHIYLCIIAKDEDHYIQEWIDYHFKLGFEKIVIYANDWIYENENENVEVIQMNGEIKQSFSYNTFLQDFKEKFWWVAFYDADEFLVLHKHNNMEELLSEYDDVQAIGINLARFGSNGHVNVINGNYNVLERFTKRATEADQEKHDDTAIKVMMRYTNTNRIDTHNCMGATHTLSRKEIYSEDDADGNTGPEDIVQMKTRPKILHRPRARVRSKPIEWDVAQLNHYFIKSIEEAEQIKLIKGTADGAPTKTIERLKSWDEYSNTVDDFTAYNFMHK